MRELAHYSLGVCAVNAWRSHCGAGRLHCRVTTCPVSLGEKTGIKPPSADANATPCAGVVKHIVVSCANGSRSTLKPTVTVMCGQQATADQDSALLHLALAR